MLGRLWTLMRHAWIDDGDSRRLVPPAALERLQARIAASERQHHGEIRLVVEAALPLSYVWRHVRDRTTLSELAHQRATMLFGKLRVWDTEHNNGVLIYLLLAERRIEVLADRALASRVDPETWRSMVDRLGQALAQGRHEAGLMQAVDEASALLDRHFPATQGEVNPNELPDAPQRL